MNYKVLMVINFFRIYSVSLNSRKLYSYIPLLLHTLVASLSWMQCVVQWQHHNAGSSQGESRQINDCTRGRAPEKPPLPRQPLYLSYLLTWRGQWQWSLNESPSLPTLKCANQCSFCKQKVSLCPGPGLGGIIKQYVSHNKIRSGRLGSHISLFVGNTYSALLSGLPSPLDCYIYLFDFENDSYKIKLLNTVLFYNHIYKISTNRVWCPST